MATKKDEGALIGALGTVVSILAKIEKVWEQRLLSDRATQDVPTQVVVSRQFKIGKDGEWTMPEVTEETIKIHRYVTQPATVGCELGATVNMGNFEFARVACTVSVPCYREEVDGASSWAKDYVEECFKKEIAEARSVTAAAKKDSPF
jgi:hypothetical protein